MLFSTKLYSLNDCDKIFSVQTQLAMEISTWPHHFYWLLIFITVKSDTMSGLSYTASLKRALYIGSI